MLTVWATILPLKALEFTVTLALGASIALVAPFVTFHCISPLKSVCDLTLKKLKSMFVFVVSFCKEIQPVEKEFIPVVSIVITIFALSVLPATSNFAFSCISEN